MILTVKVCDSEGVYHTHDFLKKRIRIGRAKDNDVIVNDPSVSAHHCEVIVHNDHIRVKDKGSGNGLIYEDQILDDLKLSDYGIIKIGNSTVDFDLDFESEGTVRIDISQYKDLRENNTQVIFFLVALYFLLGLILNLTKGYNITLPTAISGLFYDSLVVLLIIAFSGTTNRTVTDSFKLKAVSRLTFELVCSISAISLLMEVLRAIHPVLVIGSRFFITALILFYGTKFMLLTEIFHSFKKVFLSLFAAYVLLAGGGMLADHFTDEHPQKYKNFKDYSKVNIYMAYISYIHDNTRPLFAAIDEAGTELKEEIDKDGKKNEKL